VRKNTRLALAAYNAGKAARPAESIWTDGDTIYSYRTALLTRLPDGREVFNGTRYSVTTTIHQNAIRDAAYLEVDDIERGASAEDLRDAVAVKGGA
jgi:hypothetical protein